MIIVGLGNPGTEYEKTRHNVGARVLDSAREKSAFPEWKFDKKKNALVSEGVLGTEKVTFLLPQTFMNQSGNSVKNVITSPKKAEKLVVVYDDIDLPLGKVRVSFGRGSGGHNGVDSVIKAIKTKDFIRLRIGITPTTKAGKLKKPRGEQKVLDFLMSAFSQKDEKALEPIFKEAGEALEVIVTEGYLEAMNRFNQTSRKDTRRAVLVGWNPCALPND